MRNKINLSRFSDHPLCKEWVAQFQTREDKAMAAQLLNKLKRVSTREFETGLESVLIELQKSLNATLAVFPVSPPLAEEILGYDQFNGGIPKTEDSQGRAIGRRRQYGSEDRVGHILAKLQERYKRPGGPSSRIECAPTLKQISSQKIKHIVLVDDVSGSGARIAKYWKKMPRRIKRLLSLKRCELWIVLYAITPSGRKALELAIPNFPATDHLLTVMPESELTSILSKDLISLCVNYAKMHGFEASALGYRGSSCPIIFEHGCPNNSPIILWSHRRSWMPLFPNRNIPTKLKLFFDDQGEERALEALWKANQKKMAVSLLDALEGKKRLAAEDNLLLTILSLRLGNITDAEILRRLLMSTTEYSSILERAAQLGVYDSTSQQVSLLGKDLIVRFRERSISRLPQTIDTSSEPYYPTQCEGKLRKPGKADRLQDRSVPMGIHRG